MAPQAPGKNTRIQAANKQSILEAALEAFSRFGYRGTTIDQIAARAAMSKPNLLYYYRRKEDIYAAVLEHTLEEWLKPLAGLDPAGDPITELRRYVAAKLDLSRRHPDASRLFANEILQGAPHIAKVLKGPLKDIVDRKARTIAGWIGEGRIAPVDPYHLIFMIWAMTQHYADFEVQIRAILGPAKGTGPELFATAEETVMRLLSDGLRLR